MSEADMTSFMKKFLDNSSDFLNTAIENDLTGSDYTTQIDNIDLMSSEFFDSILPLKQELDEQLLDLDVDLPITSDGSITADDLQCGLSTYSDSGLSSDHQELNTEQILSDEELATLWEAKPPIDIPVTTKHKTDYTNSSNGTNYDPFRHTIFTLPTSTKAPELISKNTTLTTEAKTIPIGTVVGQPKYINIVSPVQKQSGKQLIKLGNNQSRSVLLPINIKDLKTIKIINTNNMKAEDVKITNASTVFQSPEPVIRKNMMLDDGKTKKIKITGDVILDKKIQIPSNILGKRVNVTDKVPLRKRVRVVPSTIVKDETDEDDDDNSATCSSQSIEMEKDADGQYPLLILTAEEQRLLSKDGIQLPMRYPLSKTQERELKRIRRKIRNKISAQDSRKRKKEYVDGLEERVKQCSEENRSLLKKIKLLQTQNNKLSSQLSKLRALIFKSGTSRAHPATCLMIVVLSVMLVSLPNLRNWSNDKELNNLQQYAARRALLFDQQATNEDLNTDELITLPSKESVDEVHEDVPVSFEEPEENATSSKNIGDIFVSLGESLMKHLESFSNIIPADKTVPSKGNAGVTSGDPPDYDGKATRKRMIEFEVDDFWPPPKKNATTKNILQQHVL